jgi:hypothetical protein
MTAEQYSFETIKKQYNMPFLKIGMNAIVNRKAVRVTGVSNSGLKGKLINVDNKEIYFHPTWETAYYDESWNIIRDYRS